MKQRHLKFADFEQYDVELHKLSIGIVCNMTVYLIQKVAMIQQIRLAVSERFKIVVTVTIGCISYRSATKRFYMLAARKCIITRLHFLAAGMKRTLFRIAGIFFYSCGICAQLNHYFPICFNEKCLTEHIIVFLDWKRTGDNYYESYSNS